MGLFIYKIKNNTIYNKVKGGIAVYQMPSSIRVRVTSLSQPEFARGLAGLG